MATKWTGAVNLGWESLNIGHAPQNSVDFMIKSIQYSVRDGHDLENTHALAQCNGVEYKIVEQESASREKKTIS